MISTVLIYALATAGLAVGIVIAIRSSLAPAKQPAPRGIQPGRDHSTQGRVSKHPQLYARSFVPSNSRKPK